MTKIIQTRSILEINGIQHDVTGRTIFEYKSPVKLWMKFKAEHYKPKSRELEIQGEINPHRTGMTWYMPELVHSVGQIMYQDFAVQIDLEKAVNRAIHLINENLHGKTDLAHVFFEWQEQGQTKSRALYTFVNGVMQNAQSQPIDFTSAKYLAWVKQREIFLTGQFAMANFVIDYPNRMKIYKRNQFELPFA